MVRYPDCAKEYDLVCLFRLEGAFDQACLIRAFDDLIRRHAMLRTVIGLGEEGYEQHVHGSAVVNMAVRHWGDRRAHDVAEALAAERCGADEVLNGHPLFRPALHTTADGVVLSVTLHHLIYDGWSLSVIWRDLSEFYAARTEGRSARIDPLSFSYPDFVREQRRLWPERARRSMDFWRSTLAGAPPAVPWDPPAQWRPEGSTWQTFRREFGDACPGALYAVRQVARENRISPSMVLLGATAAAVAHATGQRDLLLGTDTAGRDGGKDAWNVVGHCVNMRVTRLRIELADTPITLARKAGEAWRASEPHHHVYEDRILEVCGEPEPLKVNFAGTAGDEYEMPHLGHAVVTALDTPTPSHDRRPVKLRWHITGDGLRGSVTYRPAKVSERAVSDLTSALTSVIRELRTEAAEEDVRG
ncbi:condensation domain-containing protein [Streptomyces sp. HSG2]|uniref:condensation domain-containing protein n=1 Tax=Streptomyces sp. HSG2 TaxID=2797167 RepID=UPI001F5B1975|nr:condensation domain-containing protein [Streptomyces sp. HSG2]